MDLPDDVTPTVEQQPFHLPQVPSPSVTTNDPLSPGAHETSSSGSSSQGSSQGSTTSSSSSSSDSEPTKLDAKAGETSGGGVKTRKRSGCPSATGRSDMSNSYHEIFDTQMPPETAKVALENEVSQDEEMLREGAARLDDILLPCDNTASATTDYLTSKLVQDSLKWQTEHAQGAKGLPISPSESPSRKPRARANLDPPDDYPRKASLNPLDPNVLLDIENDARHLATSVDNLVENLSGILQSISALTVDTVETYRDGVCKTCDEVDGNIKSMYQLMAKVEELNKGMGPAYKMGEQLKDIKRLLDMMESASSNSK